MKFPLVLLKRSTYDRLKADLADAKKNDYRDANGRFKPAPKKRKK